MIQKIQNNKICPVILSGGAGTRLWPLSRAAFPKQFLPIAGQESLFHATLERVSDKTIFERPLVVCAQKHRFLVRDILSEMKCDADILMEPVGRNTAPALLAAALSVQSKSPGSVMMVMPSDHLINDTRAFVEDAQKAAKASQHNCMALFGIPPVSPHTGYGYIKKSNVSGKQEGVFKIERFTEKPNEQKATEYYESGKYLWNSGMFVMRADIIIDEIKNLCPDIYESVFQAWHSANEDLGDTLLDEENFKLAPDLSIDYAVMEKTDKSFVIPASFDWDDLGSWDSLVDHADKDENHTATIGHVLQDSVKNSYLRSEGPVLCAVDVENIIAVATKDTVAIMPRGKSDSISKVVKALKNKGRDELTQNPKVLRPWGAYEAVDEGLGTDEQKFKVKRISVKPGAALSLQKHHHRAEHWIVVRGTARVTRNDEVFDLKENQSTYIPCEAVHRLENSGDDLLEIIEVQTGNYLGEDDIVRFQDDYGRLNSDKLKKAS